ncbi:hypothetical protein V6U71_01625 [Sphingopyxis sp. J-6]|uniref:hypothetical protein n=1 Tax=Sphingopyxis sp. J-6 TaxID=3122054 RepID=UPI00398407F9
MSGRQLVWRTNLRANLILWPEVAPNIAALAQSDGEPYDEEALLDKISSFGGGKEASDTRSVRNTFEIMALSGLAMREGSPPRLRLTGHGSSLFSFLLPGEAGRFAVEGNRRLAAEYVIRALSVVLEYRAIWALWRQCGNVLTNEELNRGMARLDVVASVPEAASSIRKARAMNDPTAIGPRLYEETKFTTTPNDQRKAINPLFLLAGGGRLFVKMEDDRRIIEEWAVGLIDQALIQDLPDLIAGTSPDTAQLMSDYACAPQAVI